MKKCIIIVILVALFIGIMPGAAFAAEEINVLVNGKAVGFDVPPTQINGTTLVPIRAISEALEAEVKWDPATQKITLSRQGILNELTVNKTAAYKIKDGITSTVTLAVPPALINGKVFVPVRYIAESFDIAVAWDAKTQTVFIGPYDIPATGKYAGYRKLINHGYDDAWDVYFKLQDGNNPSEIICVSLIKEDMDEYITITDSTGLTTTLKRSQWYKLFSDLSEIALDRNDLTKLYGKFYSDWSGNYTDGIAYLVAQGYITNLAYTPPGNTLKPNQQTVYEWYGAGELAALGITLDTGGYKPGFGIEIADGAALGQYVLRLNGNVKFVDAQTKKVIYQIDFDNVRLAKNDKVEENYYGLKAGGVSIKVYSSSDYNLQFSGQDLLKLGVIDDGTGD